MDFSLGELMDESTCYAKVLSLLHPDGLRCPQCGATDRIGVHRYRRREAVPDHRCDGCGRVFNAFTGTKLHGTRRQPSALLLLLRGIVPGTSTAQLARELQCSRTSLLAWRHQVQDGAERALPPDPVAEADEMFQNAGEKRAPARGSGRPAAAPGQ
jgi:transposase-like protein